MKTSSSTRAGDHQAGRQVIWSNDDPVGHDVTGDTFESGSPGGIDGGRVLPAQFRRRAPFKTCGGAPRDGGHRRRKKSAPPAAQAEAGSASAGPVSPIPPRAGSSPSCVAAS